MPDVKHVGGFGPLLDVMRASAGTIEVSPHNPAGPISTAASLHAAAIHPEVVRTLEYSFDRMGDAAPNGRADRSGVLLLNDKPGWGVEPPPLRTSTPCPGQLHSARAPPHELMAVDRPSPPLYIPIIS